MLRTFIASLIMVFTVGSSSKADVTIATSLTGSVKSYSLESYTGFFDPPKIDVCDHNCGSFTLDISSLIRPSDPFSFDNNNSIMGSLFLQKPDFTADLFCGGLNDSCNIFSVTPRSFDALVHSDNRDYLINTLNGQVSFTQYGSAPFERTIFLDAVLSTVPEPSTWAMMLLGLGGIGFLARRKTRLAA